MARSVMKLMSIQFFSPNILLFLVEKNQELSRDRKNICNSALWYGDQTATNRSGDRGAVQSNDNYYYYCYLFIHNSYYTDIIDTEKLAVETGNKGQGSGKTTPYLVCSLSFGLSALIPEQWKFSLQQSVCCLFLPGWDIVSPLWGLPPVECQSRYPFTWGQGRETPYNGL